MAGPDPQNPAIAPSDGTCFFFTLPQELRDKIYEYALTEPDGLLLDPFQPYKLYTSPITKLEANQLRFACLQLHKETHGLATKYNAVKFHYQYHDDTAQAGAWTVDLPCQSAIARTWTPLVFLAQFVRSFLTKCFPKHKHGLRIILFEPDIGRAGLPLHEHKEDPWVDLLHCILDFCRMHPKAHVTYRTPRLNSNPDYAFFGLYLSDSLRGTDLCRVLMDEHLPKGNLAKMWVQLLKRGLDGESLNLANLHIVPTNRTFDEDEFREQVQKSPHVRYFILAQAPNGIDSWIELLKNWLEHGI